MSDKSIKSPFVKFTYTVLGPNGLPEIKSWIININIGKDNNADKVMNEILELRATGVDYSVYKINSCKM